MHGPGPRRDFAGVLDIGRVGRSFGVGQECGHGLGTGQALGRVIGRQHFTADRRRIITTHDAFGYFGREYGLTFLSPVGLSTETEASASDVAKLIGQIKAEHVKVYFFENSNDPRLVRQIAKATGAEPGGELYVETLSPPDGPASTYLKLFKYNVDQVLAGLAK